MIYQVRNPLVAETDRLVYLPDCKSATMLQRYTLEHKQVTVPNWLPTLPKNIKGFLAYVILVALVCLSAVLLASELGANENELLNVAVATAIAIFVIQYIIGVYVSWANLFNHLIKVFPVLGIPVDQSIPLRVLRQQDPDVFNQAVEVMTVPYNGTYNLAHRFSQAIDNYVDEARPLVTSASYHQIGLDTADDVRALYDKLHDNLQPMAEDCLQFIRDELKFYEVAKQYM